jgi:hypothetical protein
MKDCSDESRTPWFGLWRTMESEDQFKSGELGGRQGRRSGILQLAVLNPSWKGARVWRMWRSAQLANHGWDLRRALASVAFVLVDDSVSAS